MPALIERIVERYRDVRQGGERFLDTYRRIGIDEFKQAAYPADNKNKTTVSEEVD